MLLTQSIEIRCGSGKIIYVNSIENWERESKGNKTPTTESQFPQVGRPTEENQ